jgi:spermidine/putrescine transport system ATP-binding protein
MLHPFSYPVNSKIKKNAKISEKRGNFSAFALRQCTGEAAGRQPPCFSVKVFPKRMKKYTIWRLCSPFAAVLTLKRRLTKLIQMSDKAPEKELLRLEGIKKSFGETEVLRGIDLGVERGEFITILGSSGCGKTTLLRIIAGLEKAGEGRVFLGGRDVSGDEPNKRDVRMVFQNYALFPHINVEANVGYSLRIRGVPRKEIKKEAAAALELVQLSGYEKRMPSELSGGQKQRVAVARALVSKPPLLLLDEPLGALDLQLRRQMQIELKRLQRQLGITFIYITHDQEEALTMSDRIAVMRAGLFEQIGSAPEVYDRPRTSYVARFVGNANILRGKIISRQTGEGKEILTVETAGGIVKAALQDRSVPPAGENVTLAIRTEHVTMEPAAARTEDGAPGFPARITAKSFTGGQLRITAALTALAEGGEITASRHGIDSLLQTGAEVRVNWASPENAVPVEDTE